MGLLYGAFDSQKLVQSAKVLIIKGTEMRKIVFEACF